MSYEFVRRQDPEVYASELRIGRGVDLHLGDAAAGGVVDALGGGKVHGPVPLLAGVLLNEGDGLLDAMHH